MAELSAIVRHLDAELRTSEVPDYDAALNGLQLANGGQVSRVACAVDFSIAFRCDPNVLNCPASKHPAEVPLALHLFWIRPMTDEIDFPTAYEPAKQVSFLT